MPRTAMLFAPPQPPLTLPAEGEVFIGRSKTAHIKLTDPDTSRRHAKIVCGGGSYVVHDLLSTNGTWINGARVDEHALEPGDRITVGSTDIAFVQVESEPGLAAEPGEEAQTLFVERSTSAESFRGDLAEIPTFAVLQILEMGRKTGVLVIDSDGACGRLWLQRGDPVHAQTKGQVGFDAAVALVNAQTGRFGFEPDPEPPARTIEATVTQLLLEASRILDEGLASQEPS
jgi:pSer/pThr/pTyr-binding forkhead associated (FHA) protein